MLLVHDLDAGLLQISHRSREILFGQLQGKMGSTVVEVSSLNGLGPLKKNQLGSVLHKESRR
jgi:hypothetical protein